VRSSNTKSEQLRQVIFKLTRMLAQQGIKVTQRGTGAYCKFNTRTGKAELINLPIIPPEPTDAFIRALHGYLDHEVAHALLTVSADWQGGLSDENNVEGVRRSIRNNVINVVEDVRIENEMPNRFPGSIANLQAVRQFMIDTLWGPQLDLMGNIFDKKMAGKARTAALVPFLRAMGGHQACVQFVEDRNLMELYKPLLDQMPDMADRFKALKSTKDAAVLAEDLIRAIKNPKKKKPKPPPPPPEEKEPDTPPEQEPEEQEPEQSLGDADDGTAQDETPPDEGEGDEDQPEDTMDAGSEADEGEGEGDQPGDEPGDVGQGEDEGSGAGGEGEDADADDKAGSDKASEAEPLSSGGNGDKNITLGEAIRKLTPIQRTALILYNSKRKTVEEIAEHTKRTPNQVTRTLRDARRRLELIMEGNSK
jgi:hypothetical protein